MDTPEQETLDRLLTHIQERFYYGSGEKFFYSDKKMLTYALSWPAAWMQAKAIGCPNKEYEQLIVERCAAIAKHGQVAKWQAYFPSYLLKCLQDYFCHHEDRLYYRYTHVSHRLGSIDDLLNRCSDNAPPVCISTEVMARTHHLLAKQYRRRAKTTSEQLELF